MAIPPQPALPPIPQPVLSPLTGVAIFLVVTIDTGGEAAARAYSQIVRGCRGRLDSGSQTAG
jgi:putative iron-dependent peroxidase